MEVMDVYYVGGFGVMGWVSASKYYDGKPDPLAEVAADIVQHMNADHGDALRLLARACAGIESQDAVMTSVDRLGFHVRLKTADGPRGARIAFSREVGSPAEARSVLTEMVAQARQRCLHGFFFLDSLDENPIMQRSYIDSHVSVLPFHLN
jgi:heme iron utilization protein